MNLWTVARVAAVACYLVGISGAASAQTEAPGVTLKELPVETKSFSLGEPVPAWVDPATVPETTKGDPIVVRLADTQFSVGTTPAVYVHQALTINNVASLSAVGQIPISYAPEYQRLQIHYIGIIRGGEKQNRTTSATIRFLQREAGLEQGVYRGLVTASILVSDLRVGDTIEYSYSLLGQNPVFGGKFSDWASWDQQYPTDYRRVILNHPAERQISWRLIADRELAPLAPKETTGAGLRKLVFEMRGVAASVIEPLTPPDHAALSWLQFSEFSNWNEVAVWADELFRVRNAPGDDLRSVAEKLRRLPTPDERLVAALEVVQSEIRYFSVSLGESSHRPAAPEVVLTRRYGDCKDKSLLLMTLLRELNISSKAVLLQIGRRKGLENSLATPMMFNHVIVQATVDGNIFYLDPTLLGQHGRLSSIGQTHEGTQVLLVGPETLGPSVLSTGLPEKPLNEVSEVVTLSALDGEAELDVRQIWNGLLAERMRVTLEQMPRDRIVAAIGNAMERQYPGAKIVGDPEIKDDPVNNVISIAAVYKVPKFATENPAYWLLRYMPSNIAGALPIPNATVRKDPLYAGNFPYAAKYSFEAKLPENVSMMVDPTTKTVKSKYFNYAVTSSFRGNRAKTVFELSLLADRIDASDVQAYAADLREAGSAANGVIVIPKDALKTAALPGTAEDFPQRLRNRLQDTIDKTTATIDGGKLSGNDLANAYCDRAIYYSYLDKAEEALLDINRGQKILPDSTSLLACRGQINFQTGQFEKSVGDYSRTLSLGRTGARTFYLRGISKFYDGQLEEAATDFIRASETDDQGAQLYSDLWAIWTLQRLGRPVPEIIVKRAGMRPRGDWPRPALAMLTGVITTDEMLKIANEMSGDDRHMTLAEGYFYLGQYYLGRGEKAQAKSYFEKTRSLQVSVYIEHPAAEFELSRLKNSN